MGPQRAVRQGEGQLLTGRKRIIHVRRAVERDVPHVGGTADTLLRRGLLYGCRGERVGRRVKLAEAPRWDAAILSARVVRIGRRCRRKQYGDGNESGPPGGSHDGSQLLC
jgi:hypothetical protein